MWDFLTSPSTDAADIGEPPIWQRELRWAIGSDTMLNFIQLKIFVGSHA